MRTLGARHHFRILMQPAFRIGAIRIMFRRILDARWRKPIFLSIFNFHATHTHPTAKFFKLYVRVVNSIHFMQNDDENRVMKMRSDKSIIFSKNLARNLFLGAICRSWPDAPFAPICSTRWKNKLVEISQNYYVIFNKNREHPTSNACNFLKNIYFDACVKRIL